MTRKEYQKQYQKDYAASGKKERSGKTLLPKAQIRNMRKAKK